jgi:large subunit ribosomal protein L13
MHKTYSMKASEINKQWIHINAEGLILGRLAAIIATRLQGKHLPTYTPHMDCGDYVVVTNAHKVALTGHKLDGESFFWHTGYVGGIKSRTHRKTLESKFPERLLYKAVERMLTDNKLRDRQMSHLRLFNDTAHTHEAQKPVVFDVASLNSKNVRRIG